MNAKRLCPLVIVTFSALSATMVPATSATADPASTERIDISGPIFPNVMVMYQGEGSKYPSDPAGQKDLAHRSALTFEFLLDDCAKDYTKIRIQKDGDSLLTPEQLTTNYNEVARCAYLKYTAKPYWIPQLLADVDICGTELGAGWKLIDESDLASLSDTDFIFIADTLTPTTPVGEGMGDFYFSLAIYVRGNDGTIKQGLLTPGAATRVTPLPVSSDMLKNHLEMGLALRCIRRTPVSSNGG